MLVVKSIGLDISCIVVAKIWSKWATFLIVNYGGTLSFYKVLIPFPSFHSHNYSLNGLHFNHGTTKTFLKHFGPWPNSMEGILLIIMLDSFYLMSQDLWSYHILNCINILILQLIKCHDIHPKVSNSTTHNFKTPNTSSWH